MVIFAASIRPGDRLYLHGTGWFKVKTAYSEDGFRRMTAMRESNGKIAMIGLALKYKFTVQRPPGPPLTTEASDEW